MRQPRAVLCLLAVAVPLLTACPTRQEKQARSVLAGIPGTGTIGVQYDATLTPPAGVTITNVSAPAWLAWDAATNQLSGTPDGNDFGKFTITVTASSGGKTGTGTKDITVAAPTMTFDPAEGARTPAFGASPSNPVTVTFDPAPPTTYVGTVGVEIDRGTANVTAGQTGTTGRFDTGNGGEFELTAVKSHGTDYQGRMVLTLRSSSGETIRFRIPVTDQ